MKTDSSRPGKSGSAVPPRGPSRSSGDACPGTACKFLQGGSSLPTRFQRAHAESPCPTRGRASCGRSAPFGSSARSGKSSVISILQTCPTVEPLESSGADRPRRPRTDLAARGRRRLWSLRGESQRRNRGSGGVALDGCRRQQTRDRSCSPQVATAGSTTEWRAYGVTKQ